MTERHVIIRADASATVGSGHLVRCRTLAEGLVARGWRATFVTRDLQGDLADGLATSGIAVVQLPSGALIASEPAAILDAIGPDIALVVGDHYGLYANWYRDMRRSLPGSILMAVDDLADRPLPVDLILNQNLGANARAYAGLVSAETQVLTSPRFALLRPEFAALRARGRVRDGRVERILVFMSGGDVTDVTSRAVLGLREVGRPVDVVVGAAYPHLAALRATMDRMPTTDLHVNTPDMAALMDHADLVVGGVGSASWERCALGLPAVLVTLADNQVAAERLLVEAGAAQALGWHTAVTSAEIERAVRALCADPGRVATMSEAAAGVTDGRGTDRVVSEIEAIVARRSEAR